MSEPAKPRWEKEVVFPVIASIIEDEYRLTQRFVQRDQIAARLLEDLEVRKAVSSRVLQSSAGNMVDWFSAYFTGCKNGDRRVLKWSPLLD